MRMSQGLTTVHPGLELGRRGASCSIIRSRKHCLDRGKEPCLQLWLVVQPVGEEPSDLAVEVAPECPAKDLVDALARQVGVDSGRAAASRNLARLRRFA
jgi:hypothetical protein